MRATASHTYAAYFALLLLGALLLFRVFGQLLMHPNGFLFVVGEDALKNYYTPAYYVKYDEGLHFSGMNYPFGEHVVFTDNQPLISLALNFVDDHLFSISPYVPGILNLLMIGSILLCMVLVFRLLRRYGLPDWYAIPAAILIAALSPQIHRIEGHFALAYAFFVPLVWNLLLEAHTGRRRWLGYGLLLLTVTLFGFVHAYYALMGAVFSIAYLGVGALLGPRQARWKGLAMALLAGLVPVLVFQGFLGLTDPVSDRPDSPYGFFIYRAYLQGIFLPVEGPLWEAWYRLFNGVKRPEGEAFAYTGLVCALVFVFTLLRWGRLLMRQRLKARKLLLPALPGDLQTAFWAGVLVLLFAMAFPFTLGLEFLVDLLGPLRQFRSLGRFAWVFYYVFCVYSAFYLYLLFRRMRQRGLGAFGRWMLVLALLVWSTEAALFLQTKTKRIKEAENENIFRERPDDYAQWLAEAGRSVDEFQAILPVPAFFLGSEKFIPKYFSSQSAREAFKASYDTGLPLACGMMSRTSLSQSLQLVQILSNAYIEKDILAAYPTDKPLLLLAIEEVPLTHNEQALVPRGKRIASRGNISLYELSLESLKPQGAALIARFEAEKDSLFRQQNLYSTDSLWLHFDGFDAGALTAFGAETQKAESGILPLYEGSVPTAARMRVSVWVKADVRAADFPILHYLEYDAAGAELLHEEINPKFFANIRDQWVQVYYVFTPQSPENRTVMYIAGKYPEVESLLIHPDEAEVFMPTGDASVLMYNNTYLAP